MQAQTPESVVETTYWHALEDGRVQCDVCPRHCQLSDGQRAPVSRRSVAALKERLGIS